MSYEARCILARIEAILKSNTSSRGIPRLALSMLAADIKTGDVLLSATDTVTATRQTVEMAAVR